MNIRPLIPIVFSLALTSIAQSAVVLVDFQPNTFSGPPDSTTNGVVFSSWDEGGTNYSLDANGLTVIGRNLTEAPTGGAATGGWLHVDHVNPDWTFNPVDLSAEFDAGNSISVVVALPVANGGDRVLNITLQMWDPNANGGTGALTNRAWYHLTLTDSLVGAGFITLDTAALSTPDWVDNGSFSTADIADMNFGQIARIQILGANEGDPATTPITFQMSEMYVVPEPGSILLIGLSLGFSLLARHRRHI